MNRIVQSDIRPKWSGSGSTTSATYLVTLHLTDRMEMEMNIMEITVEYMVL